MNLDHHTLGWLTFTLMSAAMLSGALIFLNGRRSGLWTKVHIILSVLTYILMFLVIWSVR
ncbi:hypothetical protein A3L09_05055 [Thermococcus profundus]|uniref:Uncharacterized protein n=1 Tax=Thermococcus profundus TaxID=49899 RepID=A0A2Z2M877_THEPR|nr:hypothetical protein [Thermococcus profundus]ASJ02670.1 hypothetical protein A3L09_05055 [Thermococcus profundus]